MRQLYGASTRRETLGLETFTEENIAKMVVDEVDGTQRRGACRAGRTSQGLMRKFAAMIPHIQKCCAMYFDQVHGLGSKAMSLITLRFCQVLLGPFQGCQICLDLCLLVAGWFRSFDLCEVGPGASDVITLPRV